MRPMWILATGIVAAVIVGGGIAALTNIGKVFDLVDRATAQTDEALEQTDKVLELLAKYSARLDTTQALLAQCKDGTN